MHPELSVAASCRTGTCQATGNCSVSDWLGNTDSFSYDSVGNLQIQTLGNGMVTTNGFDAAERLNQSVTRTSGNITFELGMDGQSIHCEIPNDACAAGSPWRSRMRQARKRLVNLLLAAGCNPDVRALGAPRHAGPRYLGSCLGLFPASASGIPSRTRRATTSAAGSRNYIPFSGSSCDTATYFAIPEQ